jgi:hypothetical protein
MKTEMLPGDEGSFDHGSCGKNPRTYRKGNKLSVVQSSESVFILIYLCSCNNCNEVEVAVYVCGVCVCVCVCVCLFVCCISCSSSACVSACLRLLSYT